ncbi:MAG TPA: metalloregulator ArsR/SmtB family transcription factor [Rhizomicrobium sp.]|jgi:DNA-binding transcriptional ArsR family regulator
MPKSHSAPWRASLKLFQLFGHPVRFVIFQRLARQPMSAGELAKTLPVTRPAVVQHLGLLREAGLVVSCPEGRRQIYRIEPRGLETLRRWLASHLPTEKANAQKQGIPNRPLPRHPL